MRRAALMLMVLSLAGIPAAASADTLAAGGLRLVKVGGADFDKPLYTAQAAGDPSRLFVVQQGSGTSASIRVVRDGVIQPDPFLTLSGVAHRYGEQGLLGLAFAPDYQTSGRFYVYYNDDGACNGSTTGCDVRVDEYRRADADHAGARIRTLFTATHRDAGNHNGGTVTFGPDGLLYAGPGDGGTQGDPECDAQSASPTNYLGKVVRFDVNAPGATPQIYARGLRNPFRFSFDHLTGDLLIGDVGGSAREEVDFLAAGTGPGANFGWPVREGTIAGPTTSCQPSSGFAPVAPVLDYDHSGGGQAITGGVVSRDTSVAPLLGHYLYGDYALGDIRSLTAGASGGSGDGSTGLQVDQLSSFTQGDDCRVYVTSLSGPVYRLESGDGAAAACQTTPAPPAPPLDADHRSLDSKAPSLTRVGVTRKRFRASSLPTPTLARTRTPAGTTFRFSLSEKADVTVRFYRAKAGRRSKGKCVRETRRLRQARKCTRYPLRGLITRRGLAAGRRTIKFTGRVGLRALPTGRYRAILRARDAAGNLSRGRLVALRIVAR